MYTKQIQQTKLSLENNGKRRSVPKASTPHPTAEASLSTCNADVGISWHCYVLFRDAASSRPGREGCVELKLQVQGIAGCPSWRTNSVHR